jgi:hypothetical protein
LARTHAQALRELRPVNVIAPKLARFREQYRLRRVGLIDVVHRMVRIEEQILSAHPHEKPASTKL